MYKCIHFAHKNVYNTVIFTMRIIYCYNSPGFVSLGEKMLFYANAFPISVKIRAFFSAHFFL